MSPTDLETVPIEEFLRQVLEAAQKEAADSNDAASDELYVDPRD
jgi:hypothetical protein